MRLVLVDKNGIRQNGILGEPRRLEKWFVYLATLSRKTNWGVVEQHGLMHQWRSSSDSKKKGFAVFDQNSRFQKHGPTDERTSWFAQNPILQGAVFLSSRTSCMRLIFLLPLSQLPENPCCYSTGQCCSPLQTARGRNRFTALVRSSVEPFFWNLEFGQKRQNASFLGRCCSATSASIYAALLLPSLSS